MLTESKGQIAELSPKQLAKQLCAIEIRLFKQIRLYNLVDKRFEKNLAPGYKNCSDWFDSLSAYVTSCILLTGVTSARTALINRFIDVSYRCMEHRNFDTAMSLFSSLQNPGIQRLKASWKGVSMRALSQYQELEHMFSVDSNFRVYRNALRNSSPPCIPVLSLVQHDLIFIEEANERFMADGCINFERCALLAKAISDIYDLQRSYYPYSEMRGLFEQFTKVKRFDDKVLYNLSNLLEPREAVKNIPAPSISKRKQLLELSHHFRGESKQTAEILIQMDREIPTSPNLSDSTSTNKPTEHPVTPKRGLTRSRSFSEHSAIPVNVSRAIREAKSPKKGSFVATATHGGPDMSAVDSKNPDLASMLESGRSRNISKGLLDQAFPKREIRDSRELCKSLKKEKPSRKHKPGILSKTREENNSQVDKKRRKRRKHRRSESHDDSICSIEDIIQHNPINKENPLKRNATPLSLPPCSRISSSSVVGDPELPDIGDM